MGFALLLFSWSIELVGGGWFCYIYWMQPGIGGISGPGRVLFESYNGVVTVINATYQLHAPHLPLLTQEHLARFFVLVYLAIHALAGLRALTMTLRQLYILGARKRLSAREIQRFEEAFATLSRAGVLVPGGRFLRRPLIWRVRDDTQGMQMRFVGPALVVDRGLLFSPHFCPLLAHELARVNSFDWLTRAFYSLLPPLRWAALTLFGLPLGAGKLLFYPFWLVYWRWRIYTADEYAAHLGQQHALKRTLDELRWLLDGGRATPGGRWLRETPYIESRIDRLERYQSRPFEDC